jgi:hypothetical protein
VSTLDDALAQFEIIEANLSKLDKLWQRIEGLLPQGPAFGAPPEYDDASFAFRLVLAQMPAIDGLRLVDELPDYDTAGQMHLDALEVGDIGASISVSTALSEQGKRLADYRRRFQAKRRELVRDRLLALIDTVDASLRSLQGFESGRQVNDDVDSHAWSDFQSAIDEIDTLLGSGPRPLRWADLRRHARFGMVQDLLDIQKLDWPAVRDGIRASLYGEEDPLPIAIQDLGDLVAAKPSGPVAHALKWDGLTDDDFERLIFNLISNAAGYENPQWLQKTRAPDRGRDLSVTRVVSDALTGVRRFRVIVQCKHWLSRSVAVDDVGMCRTQMELWQPPRVDELVIATSGRFTADAVALIEQHNIADRALTITMWPESHLEGLLAARPHLIAEFRLRQ